MGAVLLTDEFPAAASISMLFILGAVVFGLFTKYVKPNQKVEFVAGLVLLLVMLAVGIAFPLYFTKKYIIKNLKLRNT